MNTEHVIRNARRRHCGTFVFSNLVLEERRFQVDEEDGAMFWSSCCFCFCDCCLGLSVVEGVKGQTQWHSSEDFLLLLEAQCVDWFLWFLWTLWFFWFLWGFWLFWFLRFLWALWFCWFLWVFWCLWWLLWFLQLLWLCWVFWCLWFLRFLWSQTFPSLFSLWFLFRFNDLMSDSSLSRPEPDAVFTSHWKLHVLYL